MGTTTNGKYLDVKEAKQELAEEEENENNDSNATFYETYDDTKEVPIKIPLVTPPSNTIHLLEGEEVQNEVEISDLDTDEDDADSVVSAFSNDHNYNMSPIVEPVSPISSTTDRSTPDTINTMDHGYESQLSPTSTGSYSEIEDMPMVNLDDFPLWNDLAEDFSIDPISELFPSLV